MHLNILHELLEFECKKAQTPAHPASPSVLFDPGYLKMTHQTH